MEQEVKMTKLDNLIRLNQLAEQIHKQGKKVAVLLEGRDGAGKSGTIRDFTQYLPPYTYSVVPSFMPTKKQMSCWLKSWELLMPKKSTIVFYDRSHYSRALLQPIMEWCSQKQYENFMNKVIDWEIFQGVHFVKLWLSISRKNKEKERKMKLYALRFISEYIPNQLLEKLSIIKFYFILLLIELVLSLLKINVF